jgi:HEAT repeat protein
VIAKSGHAGSLLAIPVDIHDEVIKTIPQLIELMEDKDSEIRAKATSALAEFVKHGE